MIDIANCFLIASPAKSVERYGMGHINQTYLVTCKNGEKYILQKINDVVFPDVDGLMKNICAVTQYIAASSTANFEDVLRVVRTVQGASYLKNTDGYFRMYNFIRGKTVETGATCKQFALAGEGFGKFQKLLQGFDASVLTEPIKNFHNTEARYAAFEQAFQADSLNRAKMCRAEVEFFQSRKDYCRKILDLIDFGSVPLRVTHNDTKPNNVLVDEENGSAVAVIDLDTVMAGTLLYDFGDSIRYGTNMAAEDERDLSKVVFSKQMYEAYCKGFLPQVKDVLTEGEKQNMHLGAFLMTYECGMRFLTDFLCGDIYFKISRENHNLDRCRTQITLLRQMEHNVDFMREAVAKSLN